MTQAEGPDRQALGAWGAARRRKYLLWGVAAAWTVRRADRERQRTLQRLQLRQSQAERTGGLHRHAGLAKGRSRGDRAGRAARGADDPRSLWRSSARTICPHLAEQNKEAFGCSAARNKGAATCTNMTTIRREVLEHSVLEALEHHLMDEEAVRIFCEEYAAERNRLQTRADAGRAGLEKELRQVTGDHKKLVDASIAGVPAEQVKDRMIALDARRKELESVPSSAPAPDPVRFHPALAKTYRACVGQLIRGLSDAQRQEQAKEALRALVEKIVLVPVETEEGRHASGG